MEYKLMEESDIVRILPLYLEQYNTFEDGCWTEESACRRIHQFWSIEGSYCLLAQEQGKPVGFVLGYLKQFDDCRTYHLEEIVIAHDRQGQGLGTALMEETERRVKALGAAMIHLDAVNDEMHRHFYDKLGYRNVSNFVPKTKLLNR